MAYTKDTRGTNKENIQLYMYMYNYTLYMNKLQVIQ